MNFTLFASGEQLPQGFNFPTMQVVNNDLWVAYSGSTIFRFPLMSTNLQEEHKADFPAKIVLHKNYPNPFNPSTTISFSLPSSMDVNLSIYNALGQRIAVLIDESRSAGVHQVQFISSHFSSGTYFYQLKTNNVISTKKMILLK